jgi:hypothetical protein
MGLRPADDGERKRGDTRASHRTAAERIQQAYGWLLPSRPGFSRECPWAARLWGGPPGLRLTSRSASFGPPATMKNQLARGFSTECPCACGAPIAMKNPPPSGTAPSKPSRDRQGAQHSPKVSAVLQRGKVGQVELPATSKLRKAPAREAGPHPLGVKRGDGTRR